MGPFVITVFTTPTSLRAGPVDISVLVQDREDGQPVLDSEVSVWLRRDSGRTVGGQATRAVAQSKLLYCTAVHLPEAWQWVLEVTVTTFVIIAFMTGFDRHTGGGLRQCARAGVGRLTQAVRARLLA